MLRATVVHALSVFVTCGATAFIVYIGKWPSTGWQETEENHIYYSFWQLLGLISQMLIISFALILCITHDAFKSYPSFLISDTARRLLALVAGINVVAAAVNMTSMLNRSAVATFLLDPREQLLLYILPLALCVIQLIVSAMLFVETLLSDASQKVGSADNDTLNVTLIEDTLSNMGVPFIIIIPVKNERKLAS